MFEIDHNKKMAAIDFTVIHCKPKLVLKLHSKLQFERSGQCFAARKYCSMLLTKLFSIVTPDCSWANSGEIMLYTLLTTLSKVSRKILLNHVFISPVSIPFFSLCTSTKFHLSPYLFMDNTLLEYHLSV